MNERDLLLRAILDNPADDTPRLVYADKLDELGGKANAARAEFIRLQCVPGRRTHLDREPELLRRYGPKWLPKTARGDAPWRTWRVDAMTIRFPAVTDVESLYFFRRGFVAEIAYDVCAGEIDARVAGGYVREALAANPVERVLIGRRAMNPGLELRIRHVAPAYWFATLDAGELGACTDNYQNRRSLLAALPAFLAREIPQIAFEPADIPF